MTTNWAHLPNAVHIDHVLASTKANPNAWLAPRDAVRGAAMTAAWDSARHSVELAARHSVELAARDALWDSLRDALWHTTTDYTKYLASNVIMALVAWDDCAYLLDSEPDHVKLLAALGVPAAILLYPACVLLSKERELA